MTGHKHETKREREALVLRKIQASQHGLDVAVNGLAMAPWGNGEKAENAFCVLPGLAHHPYETKPDNLDVLAVLPCWYT